MKRIHLLMSVVFLSYRAVIGQITTMEEPVSFGYRSGIPTLTRSERLMKYFEKFMKTVENENSEREQTDEN